MNTSDSGTRSEKLKCSNQQKVCTEEEEEEHLGMSVSRCVCQSSFKAHQPSRLTVKKEKKKKASEEDLQPPSSVWPNTSRHLKTSRFTSWTVSETHQQGNSLKILKQETLWHDDDVMERLGSDSRNRDSALNLIMESTISRPNLQNIHLIVRFNRGRQETRPRKNDWVTRPDHSVWGRITKSALNFNMKDTNFWT